MRKDDLYEKKLVAILLVITLTLTFSNVFAAEKVLITQDVTDAKETMIERKINEFVKSKNKNNVYDLNNEEEIELTQVIQEYKETLNSNIVSPYVYIESGIYNSSVDIGGYIFSTLDSSTSGWNHGHSGIGYSAGGNVIESNPNVGVKLYNNRVDTYWRKCANGGIYSVSGASSSQYATARNYAYSKLGCTYDFNALNTNSFYCSELVYYAWDSAGINIASSRIWGTPILPSQIMNDGDTVKNIAFPF